MVRSKFLIKKIHLRRVLNSRFEWTNEFVIEFKNGFWGSATAPQGETLSIYEHSRRTGGKEALSKTLLDINRSQKIKKAFDQREFDDFIKIHELKIDKSNTLALSAAFLNASSNSLGKYPHELLQSLFKATKRTKKKFPTILCNILNGGHHAYTNPVLSDFHEFLLAPQFNDLTALVNSFQGINQLVRRRLHRLPRTAISGNPVYYAKTKDNRVWIEFLLRILEKLNLDKDFRLMIDASGGDLKLQHKYTFSLTNKESRSSGEMVNYWINLLKTYPIQILEDPFSEEDLDAWTSLSEKFSDRVIAGDNLFATDAERIKRGGERKLASGVFIKPNQNGTISGTVEAIRTALRYKMVPITSHRSIETESVVLSDLTFAFNIPVAKMGLFSDFETIIKLNRLIRLYDNKKSRRNFPA